MVLAKRKQTASVKARARFLAVVIVTAVVFVSVHLAFNSKWNDLSEASSLLLTESSGESSYLRHDVVGDDNKLQESRNDENQQVEDNAAAPAVKVKSIDADTGKEQKEPKRDEVKQVSGIAVDSSFLRHLETLDPIPRKVHVFFPDKTFIHKEDPPSIVKMGVLNLKKLNPSWNVTIYDDSAIDVIIRDASEILSQEERDILLGESDGKGGYKNGAHIVEKTDLARLLLIYTQGGLYLDVDRVVNVKLDDLFRQNTRMCLPTVYDTNFMQDIQCSSPKNKVFLEAIQAQTKIRMTGGRGGRPLERRGGWARTEDLFAMGPPTYNTVIARVVFGKDRAIDKSDLPKARAAIDKTGKVIVTKREEWCDGFLVTPFDGCKAINRAALYKAYNITGWNDAVKARWGKVDSK